MSASDWTPEREAKLKVLWTQGLSCSQIAAQLNALPGGKLTRNAVIGKRIRLGLPERSMSRLSVDRARQAKQNHKKRREKAPAPIPRPKYTEPAYAQAPARNRPPQSADRLNAVRFIDRTPGQCSMFLDGEEGASGLVCGQPVSIGAWCSACSTLVYDNQKKVA
jgi:hypothetical protein